MSAAIAAAPEYLTLNEGAAFCRVSLSTFKRLINDGKIPVLTPTPGRRLVRRVDCVRFLECGDDGPRAA